MGLHQPTPTDTPKPAATPTPTDTPRPVATDTPRPSTPSGTLSAAKTVIDVSDTVTVSADNVSPSGQQVYITTSGPLGFAGQSPCTSGTSAPARSWSLVGCSPPGSGSVTLKTSHNGQTLSLATIAITVQATATPTPLDKPPPPGDFKAAAPIGNTGRVTLTWDRLVGADKYEVQYRLSGGAQGQSAGNWIRHDDNITGPGPTITHNVDGLTCDQSRDFRVRSYGNAALYLGDWGDQWSPILSRTPPCPPTPTPTPTVLPVPSITGHTQVAYRWLNITWTGHRDYGNRYSVQWRWKEKATATAPWTAWKALPNAPTDKDRSRAIITGNSADLRGLTYEDVHHTHSPYEWIAVRVIGRTSDGRSVTSEAYEITRVKAIAAGHQPDHTVGYDLSLLSTSSTPGNWFREAAPDAAAAWVVAAAATSTYLSVTTTQGDVKIQIYDDSATTTNPELPPEPLPVPPSANTNRCGNPPRVACVKFSPPSAASVERKLGPTPYTRMTMIFHLSPGYKDIKTKVEHFYEWTNVKSLNMKDSPGGKTFLWVGGALIHEFGHAFGLQHPAVGADMTGIMHVPNVLKEGLTTIQTADEAAIKFIYHGHVKDEGW